jgi:hypothetical protein
MTTETKHCAECGDPNSYTSNRVECDGTAKFCMCHEPDGENPSAAVEGQDAAPKPEPIVCRNCYQVLPEGVNHSVTCRPNPVVAGEAEPRPSTKLPDAILEQIRNDPGTTLYGLPMPEVTGIIVDYLAKRKAAELSAPSDTAPTERARQRIYDLWAQAKSDFGQAAYQKFVRRFIDEEMAHVTSGIRSQLTTLQQWKASAMEVLGRWDKVADYTRNHGGRLGHDSSEETLRVLQAAEEQVRKLQEENARLQEEHLEQSKELRMFRRREGC